MSKHSKLNDDQTTGKGGGKPSSASRASAPKAGSPAGKGSRSIAPKEEASWTELANFVVTFERRESETGAGVERRITAHKMQDDGITAKWTGVAQLAMCEWMTEQVADWAETPDPPSHEVERSRIQEDRAPGLAERAAQRLAFSTVRAVRPGDGSVGPGPLQSGTAFDVEALVEAKGAQGGADSSNGACSVQFFCRNTLTSEATRLGAVIATRDGDAPLYRAVLNCAGLPAGTYRIESAATFANARDSFAYGRGPLLEVA